MKKWMRKFAVILITILTLGMYPPPLGLNTETEEKDSFSAKEDFRDDSFHSTSVAGHIIERDPLDEFLGNLTNKAKEQTITKLGPRIMEQVEDELVGVILPYMETIIETVVHESDEGEVPFYEITEDPSQGLGERIFNVYDQQQNTILLKFHVRRDHRPLEGYWFNFHYHVHADNFEKHYNIGEIYWDKNVPPRWMA